jgi:hypothetical protein
VTGVRFDQRLREAAAPAEPGAAPDRRELGWQLVGWASLGLFLALVVLVTGTAPAPPPEAPRVGPVRAAVAAVPEPASTGWVLQPAVSPVERFYSGPRLWAYGCVGATCRDARTHLGSYPRDFLAAVRAFGAGRLSTGPYRGRYLVRVAGVGFRLDTVPRDGRGRPLRAWRSAVAGSLPVGTAVRVVGCGGGALCARLRAAAWTVAERSGAVGTRELRLYVGDQPGPLPTALRGATVRVQRS